MKNIGYYLAEAASTVTVERVVGLMRIAIGLLTIGHGWPKLIEGPATWYTIGQFTNYIGIYFWPTMWGFLGACTEFFGGIALTIGFGTRIACAALTFMMFVAFMMHVGKGDSYNFYSFPLSLIVVYLAYFVMGGGLWSVDSVIARHN